jgi:DNA-binding NarL/FixJ family response regulator
MFEEKLPVVLVAQKPGGRVERVLAQVVKDDHPLLTLINQEDVVDFITDAAQRGTAMPALVLVESIGDLSLKVIHDLREEATTRAIPVVVLADQIDRTRLVSALEARANSVISIPESDDALKNVAQLIRKFWLELNEVAPPLNLHSEHIPHPVSRISG